MREILTSTAILFAFALVIFMPEIRRHCRKCIFSCLCLGLLAGLSNAPAFAGEEGRVISFCHLPTGQMVGMAKMGGKTAHATLFSQEEVKFMRFTSDGPCGPKERDFFIANRTAMSHLPE